MSSTDLDPDVVREAAYAEISRADSLFRTIAEAERVYGYYSDEHDEALAKAGECSYVLEVCARAYLQPHRWFEHRDSIGGNLVSHCGDPVAMRDLHEAQRLGFVTAEQVEWLKDYVRGFGWPTE